MGLPCQSHAVPALGDNSNYNASGVVLYVGGNYNQNQNNGAFYLNGNNAASNKNANRGSHFLKSVRHNNQVNLPYIWAISIGMDFAQLLLKIMPRRDRLVHPYGRWKTC